MGPDALLGWKRVWAWDKPDRLVRQYQFPARFILSISNSSNKESYTPMNTG